MSITETVLEMHYHKPLMDLFRSTLGLGPGGGVQFFKYSQQKECFVGFDQAYVRTDMSSEEFFKLLKERALKANYRLAMKFLGYFLQFKVVKELKVRKKLTPRSVTNVPCYRVRLDTTRNPATGITLRGQCRCGRGFVAQSVSEPVPAGVLLWLAVGVVGGLRAEQALPVRDGAW